MSTIWSNDNDNASQVNYECGEFIEHPKAYRCHFAILRDDDGSFSVVVLNLPGCGSCGGTESEAIANAREAVMGVIESYDEDGADVPWQTPDMYEIPEGAKQKWILVNV